MRTSKIFTMLSVLATAAFIAAFPGGCSNKKEEPEITTEITTKTEITTEPLTELPATEPHATDPPVTEPPATEPPATNPPATEPPTEPMTRLTGYYTQKYENGDVYSGYFADGIRSGRGTYTWANGIIYTGDWIDGEPGKGEYTYPPTEPLPAESIYAKPPPPAKPPANSAQAPDPDFILHMLESAVEIPESGDKIELPPKGRSLELQYAAVPFASEIPEPFGYFNDIVFLGDSVTIGFELYKKRITYGGEAVLRDAAVISSGSYGVYNSAAEISEKSIHPTFGGKQEMPEDIIAKIDKKYVLICLGLNDVGWMAIPKYIEYYEYLIDRIKFKSPEKTVVIMSITPIVYSGQKNRLNNGTIGEANNALLELAVKKDIPFIDYAAALRDSAGNCFDELSSDAYCHLTVAAYNRLAEYLLWHPLSTR